MGTFPGSQENQEWLDSREVGFRRWDAQQPSQHLQNGVTYFVTARCIDQVFFVTRVFSGGLMPDLVSGRHTPTAQH